MEVPIRYAVYTKRVWVEQSLTNAFTEYRSILRILLKGVGLSAMLPAQSEAVTE